MKLKIKIKMIYQHNFQNLVHKLQPSIKNRTCCTKIGIYCINNLWNIFYKEKVESENL